MYGPAPYGQNPYPQQYGPPRMPGVWTCPYCGYAGPPTKSSKISTAGWVTFVVLLVFCFVLCWIGLLMTEGVTFCPSCRTKIGG